MSLPNQIRPSRLLEAITSLQRSAAKALREDTHFRLPVTMKIADADLCTYLARNESSFLFLPDQESFSTRLILRTTNEAWQQDKLPTLAICPTQHSAKELQQTTRIESISAERYFAELERAKPVTQSFTGKKSFVIGHDENPKGRFDDIVLPSFANVIVYNAHEFTSEQLTLLCEPISQVRGRLILCADWTAMERNHADIARTIDDAFGHGLPGIPVGNHPEKAWELGNHLERYAASHDRVFSCDDSKPWVVVASCLWETGANYVRSIHSSEEEALHAIPDVFAEEWKDHMFFFQAGEPPSVSAAEWHVSKFPEIGDRVRIEKHAAVSLVSPDEKFPLPEHLQPDTREADPMVKTKPFLIFHARSEAASNFPDDYTLVAKIEADNIDHAVFLSQEREAPWTSNPGVSSFSTRPRSTQPGDVIVDHDLPKRFIGDNDWRPVTTVMEPVHIHERAPTSVEVLPEPEPLNHRVSASSRKF